MWEAQYLKMSKQTVGIIGAGNMGSAIISGIYRRYEVFVCEKDKRRVTELKRSYKINPVTLKTLMEKSEIVILAIKPQQFDDMLAEIRRHVKKHHLVISIAAGITTAYIEKKLGAGIKVVRAMPNLPAQIKEGITGIAKGKVASNENVAEAEDILHQIGDTVIVDEKDIDALTAVSGSGPAYVFLFVESFLKSAKALGFDDVLSNQLVMETIKGSLKLLETTKNDPEELRKRVTSKGGTTAAALEVFHSNKFQQTFKEALKAAETKAKQLSK